MGMAAGQARLLSITSRMSDNELRAQIINNDKMRLATKSSQVSEAYVTALNDAQLMFTNYDADNNTSYQQLTFNSLTAYNQYNNQYGISDMSGRLLVSEKDAINFENAKGEVNKFLEAYGLKYETTFFDNLKQYEDVSDKTIPYMTGEYDASGNPINASSGMTAEELEEAYKDYETTIQGTAYYEYSSKLADYNTAYDAWALTIANNMKTKLESMTNSSGTNLNTLKSQIESASDAGVIAGYLNNLSNFVSQAEKLAHVNSDGTGAYFDNVNGKSASKTYFQDLQSQLSSAVNGTTTYTNANSTLTMTHNKDASGSITSSSMTFTTDDGSKMVISANKGASGYSGYTISTTDEEGNTQSFTPTVTESGSNLVFVLGDGEGAVTYTVPNFNTSLSGTTSNDNGDGTSTETGTVSSFTLTEYVPPTLDTMKQVGLSVINSLNTSIYSVWNPSLPEFRGTESPEYKAYEEAAKALELVLFGSNTLPFEDYANLGNFEWLMANLTGQAKEDFRPIANVIILDNIMNTYGEPKFAWIDSTKPTDSYNENGDAKAQWYTNLFNRMQSGGYKTLQDGLASSSEWMQFAFESGLVTMEQVDSKYTWNTVMYSNCSDITEQTNTAAVTKAEAEYNAAMNKIENKDKRYDMELKNIDTEHNSLQTEYDSIKTAIDKNIERTFKLYS
ncbi:unknown [Clostridium sp. CAG:967]|nr:unknown [Clostridium sp. CAG:967]